MNSETEIAAPDKPQTGPEVAVLINGTSKNIHRGSWKISALKEELGVKSAPNFEQVLENGDFKPWTDDQRITIKGGESFITHSGGGGSSHDR
jgi:hypothetical protein